MITIVIKMEADLSTLNNKVRGEPPVVFQLSILFLSCPLPPHPAFLFIIQEVFSHLIIQMEGPWESEESLSWEF